MVTEAAAAEDLNVLVARALREDLGSGDVTAEAVVSADSRASATVTQKEPGVIFGMDTVREVFRQMGITNFESLALEGEWHERVPLPILRVEGPSRAILTAERTALNFLGHLSGIATLTARFARAARPGGAEVLDTRKTTPGLRTLEKAAVAAGGGSNHRRGLWDAILIKENHAALAGGIGEAVESARTARPGMAIEIEVRDVAELKAGLDAGADRILLDNMEMAALRASVAARDEHAAQTGRRAELEASGGVSLATVAGISETGVDFISVGAITHSSPALDLSLLFDPS